MLAAARMGAYSDTRARQQGDWWWARSRFKQMCTYLSFMIYIFYVSAYVSISTDRCALNSYSGLRRSSSCMVPTREILLISYAGIILLDNVLQPTSCRSVIVIWFKCTTFKATKITARKLVLKTKSWCGKNVKTNWKVFIRNYKKTIRDEATKTCYPH